MPILLRPIVLLLCALPLIACANQQAASSPAPSAAHAIVAPSAAPSTAAPAPVPSATAAPTPSTAAPPATPSFAPSPSAIPAATATPISQPSAPIAARRYIFPVRSKGKVSYGRFHHDYPAADIFCPPGSAFVAVVDGVIDFVSYKDTWDPTVNDGATRGGLAVAIVGADGVRYYGSHLSQIADGIAPGARVQAGQLLGLTGNSGDARVTDPHLHFGISHPTTPEDWAVRRGEIPPYTYLQAWERGAHVTPDLTR